MKGKLPSIIMVFVAVAMVFSLVAAVATVATVNADPGADSFDRMALPSTADYQMFPDTDIWDITAADDGTVFAIVQDTSGLRWTPMSSNFRVFKSTDGGYTWDKLWAIPANEPTQVATAAGIPVEIVPQPGYDDTDAANQVVFLATDDNLYRSLNGGDSFTRIVPECPGVVDPDAAIPYDLITSLDVAENMNVPGTYVAVVGTGTLLNGGEGVFTWNEDNLLSWRDKKAGNSVYGTGYEALDVMFSPNYADDGVIVAILNDWIAGAVIMSFWVSSDGLWNGPTLSDAVLPLAPVAATAGMDTADDFHYLNSSWVFAYINTAAAGEVYAVKALAPLTGPSLVMARNAGAYARVSDILFDGTAGAGTCYLGSEAMNNVVEGKSMTLWPVWTPAIKSPAGSWPIWLADTGSAVLAATMTEVGGTTSGVSKQIAAATGSVYNGVGLMDDIAVTTDLAGAIFLVTMAYLEASPNYANDDTLFVTTASEWYLNNNAAGYDLSLWRQAPTGPDGAIVWERLLQEGISRFGLIPTGKTAIANPGIFTGAGLPALTWVTKVDPAFQYSNFIFLMAGLQPVPGLLIDRLWYSADRGDTWHPVSQMAPSAAFALSELGWCVVDNSTLLVGDSDGWVYKTTNRGNSWTAGAFTNVGVITDLNVSPIYSEAGGVGSDMAVIAGVANTGVVGSAVGQPRIDTEVWISFDGADDDFTIVGSEMMWEPNWGGTLDGVLLSMANFDAGWGTNSIVYGAASGAMADWWWNPAGDQVTLQDTEEVGVYRAMVNVGDTQASTWELLSGADDFIAETATPEDEAIMYLALSDLDIGADGTIYIPFSIFLDDSVGVLTPFSVMRFTEGGMIRCLDGTATDTEWNMVPQVLGPYDGLLLMCVVPGSNILFSAAYDVWDWRFKLAAYEDTLSGAGPAAGTDAPANGATDVGTISGNAVSVALSCADVGADTYELQVSSDSAFTSPMTTTTSDTSATVSGLEPGVTYYWRMRATEPVTGSWSDTLSFTTVATPGTVAPELMSPSAGAEAVSSTPAFSWSSVAGATSYQIQVATDSNFSSKVIDETTSSTAYQSGDELDNGTYYWKVKAATDWSATGVFTVGAVPGAGTPAWVWVVIVIGALLVIAVLVLIVRTRRAV
jgi:hypothetical protein